MTENRAMIGSCCCGAVTFELSQPPTMLATCHCSRCRKLGAANFAFVQRDAFRLSRGADAISIYPAVPPFRYNRSFCRHCGTALGEIGSTADSFPINAHMLDHGMDIRNRFHEFVDGKPDWLIIGDDAPQFPGHPRQPG